MQIYLDEPITIHGIKIGHTLPGLYHMREHYQHILTIATKAQLGDKERQDIEKLIRRYTEHIELYERDTNPKPATGNP